MAAKAASKRIVKENGKLRMAREILQRPLDLDALLPRLGVREQSALARRLSTSQESDPRRAEAWRRLAGLMFSLAAARPRTVQRAVQFYIPDGKYQQQVFALDDVVDGSLVVCCEDILEEAIAAKFLKPDGGGTGRYLVLGTPQAITIEQLDGKTENPPVYVSAMTGWNRRAIQRTQSLHLAQHRAHEHLETHVCAGRVTRQAE